MLRIDGRYSHDPNIEAFWALRGPLAQVLRQRLAGRLDDTLGKRSLWRHYHVTLARTSFDVEWMTYDEYNGCELTALVP